MSQKVKPNWFVLKSGEMFLDRALVGQGQVCFVIGEAGTGKTALVTEFARRAQEAHTDLLVAIGTCNAQTGTGDPYLPFREVLGLLTGDVEAKLAQGAITEENAIRLRAFLVRSVQVLIEVAPDLMGVLVPGSRLIALVGKAVAEKAGWTDKLERLGRRRQERSDVAEPTIKQSHIFEQYTRVLTVLAAQQPLMLVVDDLQWIDAASVSLLFHLGRRIRDSRILIVGTYRPTDVAFGRGGERHPLESVVNEFKRYYGDIWVDLDQTMEAEAEFRAAQETARVQGVRSMLWRTHIALSNLYRATAQPGEAEREFLAGRTIIEELAANVPDEALRNHFLLSANAR